MKATRKLITCTCLAGLPLLLGFAGCSTTAPTATPERQAGATMEEILEVLKLCVVQGIQACNLGVPILAEELDARTAYAHGS